MRAAEIFAGVGGLAIGTSLAGFDHTAVVERDPCACETIRQNQQFGSSIAKRWPLFEVDVRTVDYSTLGSRVDLLSAGLPCQPFSLGGKGRAHRDRRDMFGEVVRATRELQPKALLIENVKGLLRNSFREYFEYLLLALACPTLARTSSQSWRDHFAFLQRRRPKADLRYDVHVHLVNAADYGVPQWRERVLIVAFRSDLHVDWSPPPRTHSLDALLWAQWKTGDYWKRHGIVRHRRGLMSRRVQLRAPAIKKLKSMPDDRLPWKTVRDAIWDLLPPSQRDFGNRFVNPGARAYTGHCGSLLDEPAKTLKAGDHGVPGGENTLALGCGRVRYFSIRECARLQTFPDDYVIAGAWTRAMRQIGNAVPVLLARVFATEIREHLAKTVARRHPQLRSVVARRRNTTNLADARV